MAFKENKGKAASLLNYPLLYTSNFSINHLNFLVKAFALLSCFPAALLVRLLVPKRML